MQIDDTRKPLCDHRISSSKGTFKITHERNRGGSCIVYDAINEANNNEVIVKECFPIESSVIRDGNRLVWMGDTDGSKKKKDILKFKENYEMVSTLKNESGLKNFTPQVIDYFEDQETNTAYLVTDSNEGLI